MFEIKLENTQSEYRLLVFSWEIQHATVKKMRQKKKIVREIQTSRLINTACSLMLTFQAQTFIFASNISCQLHLGRSHFLSSPPSSNLVSSLLLILSISSFISSCSSLLSSVLLPSFFCLLHFLSSIFSSLPFTISPVSSGSVFRLRRCQQADTLSPPAVAEPT